MKYRQEDLAQVQKIEIGILQEIQRVCQENAIPYFTYAGTTLGLMRHQGFIPWDDDIDLGMMREDYERFLRIAPKQLKEGYFLQHFTTEPITPTYHAKVRKDGTVFVEDYCRSLHMHKGIFVDIMPFDFLPDDPKERSAYLKKAARMRNLLASKCTPKVTAEKNKYKRLVKQVVRFVLHVLLLPISKEALFKKMDNALRRYDHIPAKSICTRGLPECVFQYDDIFPLVEREFEGVAVLSPRDADAVLRAEYGNWEEIPPVEKQYTHAPVELHY